MIENPSRAARRPAGSGVQPRIDAAITMMITIGTEW